MIRRIALAVDSPSLRARLRHLLRADNIVIEEVPSAGWRKALAPETLDLVIAGLSEGDRPRDTPDAPANFDVLLLAAGADARRDALLMARGYAGVLSMELSDDELSAAILAVLRRRGRGEQVRSTTLPADEPRLDDFASASPVMQEFMSVVRRLVATDASLLITGETGVGKGRLARAIHNESRRSGGPFVAMNCAALAETLLESELFGHEAGAFTGAVRARRGVFELAHQGTIFLDEVGEMPPYLQVKLLQVLQNREFFRVGGEAPIRIDVRVMAATNRDLLVDVEAGLFRRDLFYRLGVVTVNVPPLRERREDIRLLVAECAAELRRQNPHAPREFEEAALKALEAYDWPGNVRELINVIERILLLAPGPRITLGDVAAAVSGLPPAPRRAVARRTAATNSTTGSAGDWLSLELKEVRQQAIDRVELEYLSELLRETGGRIAETARRAGVHPRWLNEKMRRFGLKKEEFKPGGRSSIPPE